jgi:hypothetical protein
MNPTLEFANFTLKFGEKDLLDYFDEIVSPAFTQNYERSTSYEIKYRFYDVSITELIVENETHRCIIGKFVKTMKIERNQILKDGELQIDRRVLESSPSSTFILILENHKLLFIREMKDAPGLKAFENTIGNFLKSSYSSYINFLWKESIKSNNKRTKISIQREHVQPKIDIIPLLSTTELKQLVEIYKIFQTLEIKLIDTNSEFHTNNFFEQARESKKALDAVQASIKFANNEGLNKKEALLQIESAGKTGNSLILTTGTSEDGAKIHSKNTELSYRIPLPDLSTSIAENAKRSIKIFKDLVTKKILKVSDSTPRNENKISINDNEASS